MNSLFLTRTFKTAWHNLTRNQVLSFGIFIVMTVALLVFQFTLATTLITDTSISLVHRQIDLTIDLQPGVQEFQIQSLTTQLKDLQNVDDAIFVPKTAALENFREHHPDIAGFLEEYGIENPLPNTVFILTSSPDEHPSILNFLQQDEFSSIVALENVTDSISDRGRTARLLEITSAIKQFALFFSFLLIIMGIFTIWNTIRIVMHARQTERRIMTLVGAEPAFMRAPYLWEGLLFGIISAFLATTLFGILLKILSPKVISYLADVPMTFTSTWSSFFPGPFLNLWDFFASHFPLIFIFTSLLGILIGAGSAFLATLSSEK